MTPTFRPSNVPTLKPTLVPTMHYDLYQNYVGDYKISFEQISHGHWLLCDGSFINKNTYPELFNIIGYTFGSYTNNNYYLNYQIQKILY